MEWSKKDEKINKINYFILDFFSMLTCASFYRCSIFFLLISHRQKKQFYWSSFCAAFSGSSIRKKSSFSLNSHFLSQFFANTIVFLWFVMQSILSKLSLVYHRWSGGFSSWKSIDCVVFSLYKDQKHIDGQGKVETMWMYIHLYIDFDILNTNNCFRYESNRIFSN